MKGLFPELNLAYSFSASQKKVLITILLAEAAFFRVNDFQRRRLLFHLCQTYPELFDADISSTTTISDYLDEILNIPAADGGAVYDGFVQLAREGGLWALLRPCEEQLLKEVKERSHNGKILLDDWQAVLEKFQVYRLSDIDYYRRCLSDPEVQVLIVEECEQCSVVAGEICDEENGDVDSTTLFRKLRQSNLTAEQRVELRNDIFQLNQRLVPFVLSKLKGSDKRSAVRDYDDDVQSGYTALLLAIDRFDLERGLCFSTYAVQCIRGSILRYRNRYRYLQHVPENQSLLLQRALRLKSEKEIELGREIELDEWAEYLRMPATRLQPLLHANQDPLYLGDTRFHEMTTDDGVWLDHLADTTDVEHEVERRELSSQIQDVLSGLQGRGGDFLRMRMGIYGSRRVWENACSRLGRVVAPGEPVSTEEIANAYQVTRSYVRQTSTKAVGKLKGIATASRLAEYL